MAKINTFLWRIVSCCIAFLYHSEISAATNMFQTAVHTYGDNADYSWSGTNTNNPGTWSGNSTLDDLLNGKNDITVVIPGTTRPEAEFDSSGWGVDEDGNIHIKPSGDVEENEGFQASCATYTDTTTGMTYQCCTQEDALTAPMPNHNEAMNALKNYALAPDAYTWHYPCGSEANRLFWGMNVKTSNGIQKVPYAQLVLMSSFAQFLYLTKFASAEGWEAICLSDSAACDNIPNTKTLVESRVPVKIKITPSSQRTVQLESSSYPWGTSLGTAQKMKCQIFVTPDFNGKGYGATLEQHINVTVDKRKACYMPTGHRGMDETGAFIYDGNCFYSSVNSNDSWMQNRS